MRSKNKNYHSQFLFEELEPRQLFSGGIEGLIATELEPTIATYIDLDRSSELETTQQNILSTAAEQQTNEIVFVDTGVENYQALVDDILNNTDSTRKIDVVLLDSNQNGIEQISDTLLDHDELNAIHIISHGSDGNIQLGNTSLNTETLTENSLAIALWAESFAESGDILIYGCNLTETEVGKNLIKSISNLTQTDVAASDDLTGQQNLGGDWNLEFNTGTIESTVVISVKTQQSWDTVLADISSGLIGHWRFDTDATDSSGNNYNGTLQGNAAIDTSNATDQVGEGKLSLDGSGDYVDLSAHVANFNGLTNGTISAWVNFTSTGDHTIFDIGDGAGQSNWVSFFVDNGKLQLTIRDGGTLVLEVSSTTSINDSTWHHVAFTSFPVGNALYIDGVQLTGGALTYLKGSSSSTFIGDLNTTTNVTIGAFQDGSVEGEFQGLLDDVRLYNRALLPADIQELNNNQIPVITSDSGGITASVNVVENNTAVTTITATDDDIDTLIYSINGGNDAAKFNINSSSGGLTFVAAPDFETPTDVGGDGTYNVTVQAGDGNGGIDTQAISVTVTNINEIPVLSNFGAAAAYTENDAPVALVPTATVIDVDNMNFDGGTLTIGYVGTVSANDVNGIQNQGVAAGEIGVSGSNVTYGGTIIGTFTGNSLLVITFNANANQAAVEALTRNITYSNSSDYISTLTRTLRFTLTDGDGGTSTSVDQTLNISDVNDAPFHTVPGTQTIIEETQTVLSGISLNDPDAFATDVFTTQLTVSNGIIDVTLSGTATISAGANGSATLTITGQAGDIDTTLSTIKYTGNTNISGIAADTLTLFTNDNGNNGAGGAKTGINTIQIDITNINDAPTLSNGNTGGSANEGSGHLPYSVATVADNDNTDFDGGELTFSIASGSDGKESLFLTPLVGVSTFGNNVYVSALLVGSFTGGSNGTPLTISFNTNATQTQVQSIFQALAIGAISGEQNPTTGLRNLEVVLTDGDGGISNVATASMTINAVNDAPVNTLPASITVIEDVATIINGISIVDVDDNGAPMLVTLSVPTGSLAATTSGGVTVGGTASDLTLTGSVTNINAFITANNVTYTTTANANGFVTLNVLTSDQGNTGSGGTLTDSDIVALNISAVNDIAVITTSAGTTSYTEQTSAVVIDVGLTIVDPDGKNGLINSSDFSAVVRISTNYDGNDLLGFTNTANIQGNLVGDTLTLSVIPAQTATVADFESALKSVTFYNGNDDPGVLDRTVSFSFNDGLVSSNIDTRIIQFTVINDSPAIANNTGVTVAEGSTGTVITTAMLNEADPDDSGIGVGLTYTVTNTPGNGTLRLNGIALVNSNTFTQANIDSGLVTYDHNGSQTSSDSFDFSLADGGEDSSVAVAGTFNLTITNINDDPINTVSGAQSVDEDTLLSIGGISVNDTDGNLSSVQLSVSNGVLNVTLSGVTISAGANNSGTLTLSGTQTDINNTLATLTYQGNPHFNGVDTVTVLSTDGNAAIDSDMVAITVNAVNDAPVNTVPVSIAVTENVATTLTGISITDIDEGGSAMQMTLSVPSGSLTASSGAGVTVSGSSSSTLTLLGSVTDINAFIAASQVTYTTAVNANGSVTLTVLTSDQGNTGSGGALTDSDNVTLNITAVNNAPILTSIEGVSLAYLENDGVTVITSTLTLSDVDSATLESAVIQITSNYQIGEDLLAFTNANGIFGSWNSVMGTLTLTGSSSVANYQAALRSVTYLNNSEAPSSATRTFSFTVNDGSVDSNTQTRNFNITPVNDAVMLTANSDNPTFTEGGIAQGLFNFVGISNTEDGQTIEQLVFTVTNVTDGADEIINIDGAAVMLTDTNIGTTSANSYGYNVSLTGSTATVTLTTTGMSRAEGQTLGDGLSYQNNSDNPTTANRVVTIASIKDSGGTANGGIDTSSPNQISTVTISAVNDAPIITGSGSAYSATEQISLAIHGTGISVSHNDDTGGNLTTELKVTNGVISVDVGDSGVTVAYTSPATIVLSSTLDQLNNLLNGSTTGTIFYQNNSDTPPASTVFTLRVNDQGNSGSDPGLTGNATSEEDIYSQTINISSINDVPTVANSIADQNAIEDSVFNFVFDATVFNDLDGDSLAYSSDASGWLSFDALTRTFSGTPLNANVGTMTVTITANDGSGGTINHSFDIVISNTNDPAVITGTSTGLVQEDVSIVANNISISGVLNITDMDASESTFISTTIIGSYGSLTIDTSGNWSYTADNSQSAIQQLDNGESLIDTLTVTAFDGTPHDIVITLNGTEDTPILTSSITNKVVTEGNLFDFTFADTTFSDIDASDTLTYTATLADDSALPAWLTFNPSTRQFTGTPSNANVGVLNIKLTATDGSSSVVDSFDLTIINAQETPIISGVSSSSVTEDVSVLTGNISASASLTIVDPDVGESSFVAETINGNYGSLTIDTVGNWSYRADNHQQAIQQLDKGESLIETLTVFSFDGTPQNIVITLNGAEDVPTLTSSIANQSATEDTLFSFIFASTTFNDVDVSDTLSYTATLDNDDPLPIWLSFDSVSRTLSGTPSINDVGLVNIKVTATDGTSVVFEQFTLTVNNNDEKPIIDLSGISGDDTGSVTEDIVEVSGNLTLVDNLTNIDPNLSPPSFIAETVIGTYGSLTIDESGNWSYTLSSLATIQQLDVGERIFDTLSITTAEGIKHNIIITLAGAEDPNVSTPPSSDNIDEVDVTRLFGIIPADFDLNMGSGLDLGSNPNFRTNPVLTINRDSFPDEQGAIFSNELMDETVKFSANYLPLEFEDSTEISDEVEPDEVVENRTTHKSLQIKTLLARLANQNRFDLYLDSENDIDEEEDLALWNRIDTIRKQMDDNAETENQIEVQVMLGTSVGLTAGFVSWFLRGGALLASFMSTVPLMHRFDPLPILKAPVKKEKNSVSARKTKNQESSYSE